ncbi:MAG: hypothetical protein AB7K09_22840 [Planctomycetota bacterium]
MWIPAIDLLAARIPLIISSNPWIMGVSIGLIVIVAVARSMGSKNNDK